jgi:hypothetical protein
MINDALEAKGYVEFVVTAPNGDIKEKRVTNTVVNAGKLFMTSRLFANASDTFTYHIGIGTDATAVAASQTALIAPAGDRLPSATPVLAMTTIADDSIQLEAMFGVSQASVVVAEAGLFTALTGGTMIARTTFGAITKGPDDTLTITWKLQQA